MVMVPYKSDLSRIQSLQIDPIPIINKESKTKTASNPINSNYEKIVIKCLSIADRIAIAGTTQSQEYHQVEYTI